MSSQPTEPQGTPPRSDRVRLRRKRERGTHEREVIDAILDEGLIAHLGIADERGQPFVVPTLHAPQPGDLVYCHGSVASRTIKTLAGGAPACLTVSLIDGLVLARSAMIYSANYRSDAARDGAGGRGPRRAAPRRGGDRGTHRPGRLGEVRHRAATSSRATAMLALPIDEASAKVRTGGPLDDEEDYALPAWAGVIPTTRPGAPRPDTRLADGVPVPEHAAATAARRVRARSPRRPSRACRGLDAQQLERARAAPEQQALAANVHPGLGVPRVRGERGAAHPQRLAPRELGAGTDVRLQGPHDTGELDGRASRVQGAVGGGDLLRVRRLAALLDEGRRLLEGPEEQGGAEILEAPGQRP